MMPTFDTEAFMRKLRQAAATRGKTMKEVAAETGVSETTLSRMSSGQRVCDAASLAALSAWAGINPARYSGWVPPRPTRSSSIAGTKLRANVGVQRRPAEHFDNQGRPRAVRWNAGLELMSINAAIDAVARCVKCGATKGEGCACWVRLECPKCGNAKTVERDDTDPPATAKVRTLCPECCGGDFSEVIYFDRTGRQILEF